MCHFHSVPAQGKILEQSEQILKFYIYHNTAPSAQTINTEQTTPFSIQFIIAIRVECNIVYKHHNITHQVTIKTGRNNTLKLIFMSSAK
jgi:hypothetical protein